MPTIQNIRNDLDNVLQSKQSLMSIKRYNSYWYEIAEHWDNKRNYSKSTRKSIKLSNQRYPNSKRNSKH